jgi:enterochelin esterase family protein
MKVRFVSIAGLAVSLFVAPVDGQVADHPTSPTMAAIAKAVSEGDGSAIRRFWDSMKLRPSPLVEAIPDDSAHVLATFLWRGDSAVRDIVLMAQPDGIAPPRDPRSHLSVLAGTDIWYRTFVIPAEAEFSYVLAINPPSNASGNDLAATFRPDPLNPLRYKILTGPTRSIARMPGVDANLWTSERRVRAGVIREHSLTTSILKTGSSRRIWVYRSAGKMENHPNLVIFLDGATYVNAVPTTRILDNLFASGRIGSTIAVFVADGNGDAWKTDLYFSEQFVNFLTDELLPWVQRQYGFTATPERTGIAGESIAGLTAAFVALHRPDVFTKVLAQSASFWLNNRYADNGEPEWLARQFLRTKKLNVSFWLDVGAMEFVPNENDRIFPPFVPGSSNLLAANRHLRDVLRAKCYDLWYNESYGAHEPLRWTRTLPQGLMLLFGHRGSESAPDPSAAYTNPACRTN